MITHNLNYYGKLYGKYEEFQRNTQIRREKAYFFDPNYLLIRPISLRATELLITPIKWAYSGIGSAAVKVTSYFNPKLGLWVDDVWHDPISTKTMLKIGIWIQSKARIIAIRQPVSYRLLHPLDRAFIAFFQHIHVVTGDLNDLLRIPQKFRDYLISETVKNDPQKKPKSLAGWIWQWVKISTAKVKDGLLALIHLIVKAVEIPLQYMPIVKQALVKIGETLERARTDLHNAFIAKAHRVIDKNERKIRHKVVAKVAEAIARKSITLIISTGLNIALGAGAYLLAKHAFTQVTGIQDLPPEVIRISSIALHFAGAYLWIRCMTPTLHGFYQDYEKKFDPEASTLLELSNLLDRRNFVPVIKFIKKRFL
ncbi:MAG: hypothetical protein K1000chlam3_00840 [Chlamydiae bacterium]|nr:hypothetical protein [Chlamydiota bacterium]